MRDLQWLVPCVVLTTLLGLAANILPVFSGYTGSSEPALFLGGWFTWTAACFVAAVILYTLKMMLAGQPEPIRSLRAQLPKAALAFVGMMLAGTEKFFFTAVKPQLNALFPFWADPYLAAADRAIFGTDPWRLLTFLDVDLMAEVYTLIWFLVIVSTLFWLLLQPPSKAKTAGIVCYFALWAVFGTVGQAMFASAGPIFYERIGLGSDFAAMDIPRLTQSVSNHLWFIFDNRQLALGGGISAMPSLHIATMAWAVIVLACYRSRLAIPALGFALYIYAGSILLGWHYALDGVVGAVGAGLSLWACLRYAALVANEHSGVGHNVLAPAAGTGAGPVHRG